MQVITNQLFTQNREVHHALAGIYACNNIISGTQVQGGHKSVN